jgi:phosphocarrier protein HPr
VILRTTTICNKLGLHARAASKLVHVAQEFSAKIAITNGQQSANGKSIMSVLMLQAKIATQLTLQTDGVDEVAAMDAIVALIENRFDEHE